MSLEVPGTSDLTKKRRVRGGHKSYVTKVLGQSAVLLADQLSHENGLQLRQQKVQLEEKLATIKFLDNQILDLLETEQDIDHEIDESSKFCEGIYRTLLQIDDKLKQLDITASGHAGGGNGNSAQPFQGEQELTLNCQSCSYGSFTGRLISGLNFRTLSKHLWMLTKV